MTCRPGSGLERNISATEVTFEVFLVVNRSPSQETIVDKYGRFLAVPAALQNRINFVDCKK